MPTFQELIIAQSSLSTGSLQELLLNPGQSGTGGGKTIHIPTDIAIGVIEAVSIVPGILEKTDMIYGSLVKQDEVVGYIQEQEIIGVKVEQETIKGDTSCP